MGQIERQRFILSRMSNLQKKIDAGETLVGSNSTFYKNNIDTLSDIQVPELKKTENKKHKPKNTPEKSFSQNRADEKREEEIRRFMNLHKNT